MKNHPVAATVAALTMFGAIGALAVSKIQPDFEPVTRLRTAAESPLTPEPSEEAKALVQRIRAAVQLGTEGRLEKAEGVLAELAAEYPREPLVWMNYGVALSGQNKLDEATEAFERVLDLRPEAWSAYGELATIRMLRDDLDGAIALLEKIPDGAGRVAERLRRDPVWRNVDDPRVERLRRKHREIPETSIHVDEVTASP